MITMETVVVRNQNPNRIEVLNTINATQYLDDSLQYPDCTTLDQSATLIM